MKFTSFFLSALILSRSILSAESNWDQYRDNIVALVPTAQGWCPQDKALRMMNLIHERVTDPHPVLVEIGVFGGSSFFPTVAALSYENRGIAYGIDPWHNTPCLNGLDGENYSWWSKIDLKKVLVRFMDLMHENQLDDRYCLMRMTSQQAVRFFHDNSVTVLHIDGNHSEDSAFYDAKSWLPKVKIGGFIWFDDANWSSTKAAVMYLLEHCELDPSCSYGDAYLLFRKTSS